MSTGMTEPTLCNSWPKVICHLMALNGFNIFILFITKTKAAAKVAFSLLMRL
jgi:hypothetical protein